jgi:chloride channel 3/4/5
LTFSRLAAQRPISAYDAPLDPKDENAEIDADLDANGIRVWYSSFSSIDWLHDAIKDSVRFSRLRKRKSFRARVRLAVDKSIGWFIVTIVGFLTAIVAFLVVRSEQWLFDSKEGYCHEAWWKAKRFCCPHLDDGELNLTDSMRIHATEEVCSAWRTWAEAFGGGEFLQYISYAIIAVSVMFPFASWTLYNYLVALALPRHDILSSHDLSNKLYNFHDTQRIRCSRS